MRHHKLSRRLFIVAIAVAANASVRAADKYYVGAGGLWQTGPWSTTLGGPPNTTAPVSGDNALLISPASLTVTRDASSGNLTGLASISIDGTGGAEVTLAKLGNTTLSTAKLTAGSSGFGVMTQDGGTVIFTSSMTVGRAVGSVGTYLLNSGALVSAPFVDFGFANVGLGGFGQFTMTGGFANLSPGLFVGANSSGIGGRVDMSGGTMLTSLVCGVTANVNGNFLLTGGTVTLDGAVANPGSSFINQGGAVSLNFGGSGFLANGGTLDFGVSPFTVTTSTPLELDNGYFAAANITATNATIAFNSGTLVFNASGFSPGTSSILGTGSINLPSTRTLIVSGTTALDAVRPIVLNGGTFSTGAVSGNSGALQFNSGTFRLTASYLEFGAGTLFGATFTLDANRRLEVAGGYSTIIDPGSQLYVTGGALDSPAGINNQGLLQLASPVARVSASLVANTGLIAGTGRLIASLDNQLGGEVRINAADAMRIEGASHTNEGAINVFGSVDFTGDLANSASINLQNGVASVIGTLTNAATGRITGRGTLFTTALSNAGSVLLSGGLSDVHGTLSNASGAKTIVTGNATANFYDDVTNDPGSEFRVSANSTAVFFGNVTGLGQFSGTGVKDFEGTTLPGPIATPGSTFVGFNGNVMAQHVREAALSVEGSLVIVANGTSSGVSRVGALDVPGGKIDLTNNALIVDYSTASPIAAIKTLIVSGRSGGSWTGDGITSSLANAGTFGIGYADASAINVSDLLGQSVDGTTVLIRYTYYGDANLDGQVNTLDFNRLAQNFNATGKLWSDGDSNYDGTVNALDFNAIATNYGATLPSPPALGSLVPEPTAIALATFAVYVLAQRRRH